MFEHGFGICSWPFSIVIVQTTNLIETQNGESCNHVKAFPHPGPEPGAFLQYHGQVLNVDAGLAMGSPQHGGWDPSFFIYCLFLHLVNGTGQSCS